MGASGNHYPQWLIIRPDFTAETIRLLRHMPPEDVACYLLVVAVELQAIGKLTPARLARISALIERAMRLDKAA